MDRKSQSQKRSSFKKACIAACGAMGLASNAAHTLRAAVLTWDPSNTPATPSGTTGNWDYVGSTWATGGTQVVFTSGSDAVFNTANAAPTLAANITANSLTITAITAVAGPANYTLTLNTAPVYDTSTSSISAILASTAGITKTGAGALTLNPLANDSVTGGISVAAGTLAEDFSNNAASLSNMFSSSNALAISGNNAIFSLRAKSTGAKSSQSFSSTSIGAGLTNIQALLGTTSNFPNQSTLLSLGPVTQSVGGTVDFSLPSSAQQTSEATQSSSNGITTTSTNVNGILGAWATTGNIAASVFTDKTDYASVNANGNIVAATYTSNSFAAGANTDVTSSFQPSANAETNSLHFNVASAYTVTLSGTNTLDSGGILNGATSGANAQTVTGGTLSRTGGGEMTFISYAGTVASGVASGGLVIGSSIVDGGNPTQLTLNGTGVITLSGTNTYTGNTSVDTTSTLFLNSSAYAIGGNVTLLGGTIRQNANNQIAPTSVVNFNSLSTPTLELNGTNLTIQGLTGTTTGTVQNGTSSTISNLTLNTPASTTYVFDGSLKATGTLNVIKNGTGKQTVAPGGNFATSQTINAGTLQYDTLNGVSNGTTTAFNFNSGTTFEISNENDTANRSGTFTGAFNYLSGDSSIISSQDNTGFTLSMGVAYNGGTRSPGGTVNYIITGGTPGTTNILRVTNVTGFANQGEFYDGADYAYGTNTTSVRAPMYGTDSGFVTAGSALATGHNLVTTSITGQPAIATLNTIKFGTSSEVDLGLATNATVTVGTSTSTSGLLRSGGGATVISGGAGIKPFAAAELVIRTDTASDSLTIDSPLLASGVNAVTKSGAGLLRIGNVANYTGATYVNAGTLSIDASSTGSSPSAALTATPSINVLSGAVLQLVSVTAGATTSMINDAANLYLSGTTVSPIVVLNTNSAIETVNGLVFNGIGQPAGTYDASSVPSGSTLSTADFSGTGELSVTSAVPEPSMISCIGVGGLALLPRRRARNTAAKPTLA